MFIIILFFFSLEKYYSQAYKVLSMLRIESAKIAHLINVHARMRKESSVFLVFLSIFLSQMQYSDCCIYLYHHKYHEKDEP